MFSLRRIEGDKTSAAPGRGVLLLLAAAVGTSLGVVLIFGVGVDLPGPKIRETLGLAEDAAEPRADVACAPSAELTKHPREPKPVTGRWDREADLPLARDELRVAMADATIFLTNGLEPADEIDINAPGSTAIVQSFDPITATYDRQPDSPQPLDHALSAGHDGRLYVLGGRRDGVPEDGLWHYDPAARKWEELASMPLASYAPAGGVIDGRLFVAGGSIGEPGSTFQGVSALQIYDFQSGRWVLGRDMPTPRHHAAAAALDGKLYVAGGRRDASNQSLDAFERFDPKRTAWEQMPALPQAVGGPAMVATDDEIVVIGGGDDAEGWVTGAVWAFDPGSERWRRLPDLEVPRHGHGAAVLAGRVYVFGGSPCPGYGRTEVVESLRIP